MHTPTYTALFLACALWLVAGASAAPPPGEVTVHADQPAGRFRSEAYTNASFGSSYGQLVSPLADPALQWVRATNGLAYVRCWNWLGDGMPKSRPEWFAGAAVAPARADGKLVYEWDRLERVLDTLVASGVKPFIVCGGLPSALLEGEPRRNESGAAVNRPRDLAQYQDMLAQMFRRLVKTYGAPEVRSWYFEVWSHPDHAGSWEGGRAAPFSGDLSEAQAAPFLRLYDAFAAAADGVDPKIRIGGPGLAGDLSFLRRFLEHCARGRSATARPGTRLDFISWGRYGTVAEIARWNDDVASMIARDFPELKGAQLVLNESGLGPTEAARANTAYEAARLAALIDANGRAERGVDLLFRSGDLVDDHFNGFRPLITRIGENTVPLPAFRLNMLLTRMGAERLRAEVPDGIGAVAARAAGKGQKNAVQVLLYRHDPTVAPGAGAAMPVKVRIQGLPASLLRLPARVYAIDEASSSAYESWQAAGKPDPAPVELGKKLAEAAPIRPAIDEGGVAITAGAATLEVSLKPNSVALLAIGAEPTYGIRLGARGERLLRAEQEFASAAALLRAKSWEKGVQALRKIETQYGDTYWREAALYALVGVYELDLRSPAEAEAIRRELAAGPVDDLTRLRLLERLRVDAVRKGDAVGEKDLTRRIRELETAFLARRQWPLQRYQ